MSAPAINVLPSQMMIMELTSALLMASLTPLFNPSLTFADNAFTGGELSVITATESLTSKVVTSLMVGIVLPLLCLNRLTMLA